MGLLCTCDKFQNLVCLPMSRCRWRTHFLSCSLTKAGFMSISADSERETPHSSESMDKDNKINLKPLTRVTVRYRSLEFCWLSNLPKMPMHKPSNIYILSIVKQYGLI